MQRTAIATEVEACSRPGRFFSALRSLRGELEFSGVV